MKSFIVNKGNQIKEVKNLGWLLRNWKRVKKLGFNYDPNYKKMCDGQLVAYLDDSSVYFSDFASLSVCWNWLNRPVFRGSLFELVFNDFSKRATFIIGNEEWKKVNKLDYKEFQNYLNSLVCY